MTYFCHTIFALIICPPPPLQCSHCSIYLSTSQDLAKVSCLSLSLSSPPPRYPAALRFAFSFNPVSTFYSSTSRRADKLWKTAHASPRSKDARRSRRALHPPPRPLRWPTAAARAHRFPPPPLRYPRPTFCGCVNKVSDPCSALHTVSESINDSNGPSLPLAHSLALQRQPPSSLNTPRPTPAPRHRARFQFWCLLQSKAPTRKYFATTTAPCQLKT
jgi:hypothetical protein